MKRLGAATTATSRRKRIDANEIATAVRPYGELTDEEVENLRQAKKNPMQMPEIVFGIA